MKNLLFRRGAVVAALLPFLGSLLLPLARAAEPAAGTGRIVAATQAFLGQLDDRQRQAASFAWTDDEQRKRWSNLPTGIFQRKGLRLGDLKGPQRAAAMSILQAALSKSGYEKVVSIIDAEEYLRKTDSAGGGRLVFGADEFYLSFLGTPSESAPWTIQFGGHHLALNITISGPEGLLTPSLTAVQPAVFPRDGKQVRPLGRETDLAFELINALDDTQRKKALLGARFRDLVLGPGQDGKTIQPEGIQGKDLTPKQQALLLDLAAEWTGIVHDSAAAAKRADVKSHLADTWFAWSGPTTAGQPAYFRIQGPTVFIEYAPQSLGGDPTKHLHTIYRDPTNEYGRKITPRP